MIRRRALAALVGLTVVASACGTDGPDPLERSADVSSATTGTAPTTTETQTTTTAATTSTVTTPAEPEAHIDPASDPAEMARRLVEGEQAVRAGTVDDPAVADHAFALQILYRQLARTPDWDAAVIDAAPESLRLAVGQNIAARREFGAMHTRLSDTLPAWRIVEPAPADELLGYYREAEATFGVPWEILAGVNLVETGLGRIRGTSTAGAQGPMQFLPATWAAFGDGGDIEDTHDAIMGAARYLAHNGGGSGNIDGALWNYNHSDHYVDGVKHYAAVLADDPAAFNGYYHWQIVYLSTVGDVWLAPGYDAAEKIPVADYVAAHPDRLVS